MSTPAGAADAFRQLDFHDDTLVSISVLPTHRRGEGEASVIEIHLRRHSEDKLRLIRFTGCANARLAMDFDVLADNLPANTSRVEAGTDLAEIRSLVESQERDWDVGYGRQAASPLTRKVAVLRDLVFFRVQFFGGAIDVIAREYQTQTTYPHLQGTAAPPRKASTSESDPI